MTDTSDVFLADVKVEPDCVSQRSPPSSLRMPHSCVVGVEANDPPSEEVMHEDSAEH